MSGSNDFFQRLLDLKTHASPLINIVLLLVLSLSFRLRAWANGRRRTRATTAAGPDGRAPPNRDPSLRRAKSRSLHNRFRFPRTVALAVPWRCDTCARSFAPHAGARHLGRPGRGVVAVAAARSANRLRRTNGRKRRIKTRDEKRELNHSSHV